MLMPLFKAGQRLDNYDILEFIANGGMGEVYRARHVMMDTEVALKIAFPHLMADPEVAGRFLREVRAAVKLKHPHIVEVVNAGQAEGFYFVAMEYLPGLSLAGEIRALRKAGRRMEIAKAVDITRQIALALDYAHRAGYVHRDVKPNNILRRSEGHYVLTDFGLVLDESATRMTHTGWGMGTPAYMPPEQWDGKADSRSDIYALGITLYEMLSGEVPFNATPPSALMRKHMTEQPRSLLDVRPELPTTLQRVVARALAKKVADRYQTGVQFVSALDAVAQVPRTTSRFAVPEAGAVPRAQTVRVSRRMLLVGGGGIAGAGVLGLAALGVSRLFSGAASVAQSSPTRAQATLIPRVTDSLPPGPESGSPTSRPVAATDPSATRLTLAPGVTLDVVRVPAGEFVIGSADSDTLAASGEKPQQRIALPEYWIGKTEVTVAQFAAFTRAANYNSAASGDLANKGRHPVSDVTWDDAVAFCKWASQVTAASVQLPSEAEWEKAARGTDGRQYPWGSEAPDATRCNFNNGERDTTPVGKYSARGASPYGCDDMAGNVLEWSRSLSKPYPYQADDGRENGADRGLRVLRGGAFGDLAQSVRCAYRDGASPELHNVNIGFRVVVARLPSF